MDWFEALAGFRELDYEATRRNFEIVDGRLRSKVNGKSYGIGTLETPSLADLRNRGSEAAEKLTGNIAVAVLSGDVRKLHAEARNANALFQVASQFNLLEMPGYNTCPDDGVTGYQHDHTQGPACAIAAGAATIYRNYFAPVGKRAGQTRDCQIDCLKDVGAALGNDDGKLWHMVNGYALCSEDGLAQIDRELGRLDAKQTDDLRAKLRVGLHWNVEVTEAPKTRHAVSQVFCSALPVSYTRVPAARWRTFATLVLEGAYEATFWAAVLNNLQYGSRTVFLTRLGGGAFGNETAWIDTAIRRALRQFRRVGLDVRLVSYGTPDEELVRIAETL